MSENNTPDKYDPIPGVRDTIDCLRMENVELKKENSWLKAWRVVARKWFHGRPEKVKELEDQLKDLIKFLRQLSLSPHDDLQREEIIKRHNQ